MEKHIVIFSIGIANELIRRGYNIQKLKINDKNNNRTVALFENTEELREELKQDFDINI